MSMLHIYLLNLIKTKTITITITETEKITTKNVLRWKFNQTEKKNRS